MRTFKHMCLSYSLFTRCCTKLQWLFDCLRLRYLVFKGVTLYSIVLQGITWYYMSLGGVTQSYRVLPVILLPLRPVSLMHKNPQRRKIFCGMHPVGCEGWSIDLRIFFCRISCSCDFRGCSCGCFFRVLQGVTWCYTVLHGVIRCYMVLHGVTWCYTVLHGVT